MRPPMFQYQPSPFAMARARSLSRCSSDHSIATRTSSTDSPKRANHFPVGGPVRGVGDVDGRGEVARVPQTSRVRLATARQPLAPVLGEGLEQPESRARSSR